MVQLKSPLHQNLFTSYECFNSCMVQLKCRGAYTADNASFSFNSCMVQLKLLEFARLYVYTLLF